MLINFFFTFHSGNESTDSGNHSGTNCRKPEGISGSRSGSVSSSPVDDRLSYKIGDLGHVAQIHGDPGNFCFSSKSISDNALNYLGIWVHYLKDNSNFDNEFPVKTFFRNDF